MHLINKMLDRLTKTQPEKIMFRQFGISPLIVLVLIDTSFRGKKVRTFILVLLTAISTNCYHVIHDKYLTEHLNQNENIKTYSNMLTENSGTMKINCNSNVPGEKLRANKMIAGKGGANILLCDNNNKLVEIFGKPSVSYTYDYPCEVYQELGFLDKTLNNYVVAYLRNNEVFKIRIEYSDKFLTAEGIKFDMSEKDLLRKYSAKKSLEKFTLFYRDFDFIEGFPTYWVDQKNGIAFEVYAVNSDKKLVRKVKSIEIFDPSFQYIPKACLSDIKNFVRE